MRIKIIIILLCLVLFTGCSNLVNTEPKQSNNIENFKKYDLLISNLKTYNGEIELKVGPLNDTKDIFNGIAVSYNNIDKLYDWQNSTNEAYKPIIYFEDITNDGINEIIINTTLGYGTGLNINEIHILNSKDLNEYKVENINNYIKKHIKTNIDDTLTISIKDKIQQIDIDNFKTEVSLYKEAFLGNVITYEVINNKIIANVAVQISDTDFLGSLVFEYDFVDNGFDILNVYYKN